ncbi:Pheromone-processing carboxypeptidase KEX1 [Smittium culicis]|uniref:Pheromone-processing carboxypeptidase KEX1 n=1 Tax=Smittium culicis TaxID=133412 RepID=A0A1R1YAC8_9FUNG|nr:Pheromone-processing carboxypeptidase KEX1 [Smittium culicis]
MNKTLAIDTSFIKRDEKISSPSNSTIPASNSTDSAQESSLMNKLKSATDKAVNDLISLANSVMSAANDTSTPVSSKALKEGPTHTPKTKSDYLVGKLPDVADSRLDQIQNYAGLLNLEDKSKELFFWLAQNKTNSQNKDTLFLWLNGGPGCSSMDGMFLENGPYMFDTNSTSPKLIMRDYAWSNLVDVLYVDQPFGTGFSPVPESGTASNYVDADKSMVSFLLRFFSVFPEYKSKKLYIAGESQAGINLQGVMIGNGWIDPRTMYTSYLPFMKTYDLVSQKSLEQMSQLTSSCLTYLDSRSNQKISNSPCDQIFNTLLSDNKFGESTCLNVYDLRLKENKPSCGMDWPPGLSQMTQYLNRKDVQEALNIKNFDSTYKECNSQVSRGLSDDQSEPSIIKLPDILAKIPVNLFAGDMDIICNQLGHEYMISNLTWNGSKGFSLVNPLDNFPSPSPLNKRLDLQVSKSKALYPSWSVNGRSSGSIHTERKLTYSIIYNASHMTGFDKPAEMLDLIKRFANLNGSDLGDMLSSNLKSLLEQQKSMLLSEDGEVEIKNRKVNNIAFTVLMILFLAFAVGLAVVILKKATKKNRYVCFGSAPGFGSGRSLLSSRNNGLNSSELGSGNQDTFVTEYFQLDDLCRSSFQDNDENTLPTGTSLGKNSSKSKRVIVNDEDEEQALEYDFRNGESFDYEKFVEEDYDSSRSSSPDLDK